MKKTKIIPTIFSTNKIDFDKRFNQLRKISRDLQIDFMDGRLVDSKSISLNEVPNLSRYKNNFEAHLMVKNPGRWIPDLEKKGFSKVIFHIEAMKNKNKREIGKFISKAKKSIPKVFIAINPKTSLEKIIPVLSKIEGVLVMGVNPGKEGQKLSNNTIKRIKELKKISNKIIIQIDGGVNEKNIHSISKAGADIINSGSFVGRSDNPRIALYVLKKKL